ncbi:hypothetical protein B0H14DRAFT_2595486 [Mycena olivaceomarginata]|nr:hypothetical protein B0H14DRAFT_2595486 [Mycena olivaceomarginata]
METQNFCKQQFLGNDISNRLQWEGFGTPGTLLFVSDAQLREAGFKVGHIAELRRALGRVVGGEVQETQVGTTYLYGGLGGQGGPGGQKGGPGGRGEAPVVPPGLRNWFTGIWGGKGGEGGLNGQTNVPDGTSQNFPSQKFPRTHYAHEAATLWTWILKLLPNLFGNAGSEGPWLFGGIGGKGGFGGIFGGGGGTGKGSRFSELLVRVDQNARSARPTLLDGFAISGSLRQLLQDEGFVTVEGLFEVTEDDLLNVGFKLGHLLH